MPIINGLLQPKSVIDIGCGIGTFLYAFKELGVSNVLGIDGKWTNKQLLSKYLEIEEFQEADLSEFVQLEKEYDLAVCLEVAEHIDEKYAENLVKTLIHSSKVILFSAAIPYQSGQHHINEQWPTYWEKKFLKHDFYFNDIIRPAIWDKEDIEFWYKQNIFLITHAGYSFNSIKNYKTSPITNMVHPDLYSKKSKQLNTIVTGEGKIEYYFKLLVKACLKKAGLFALKSY